MESQRRLSRYLDPKLLASLANLEIKARGVVEGFIEGLHKSPFKGFNVEFAEYRQYVPGDPIKDIDWKVYARTDKYYIKEHEEETNLSGYLIMDTSGSMSYKGDGLLNKMDYASTLAASLAYLMLRQQDSVGLVTFAEGVRKIIRPRGGMAHLKAICTEFEQTKPTDKTDIGESLDRVAETMRKRGLLIIFSDLLDNAATVINKARLLRSRRHEVLIFHILDRHELNFPFEDTTLFRDLEDRSELVIDAYSLRREYLRRIQAFVGTFKSALRRGGIDYLLTDTSRPLEASLKSFFTRRQSMGHGVA
ncbi:MAG TPA: DUF58 domain-containing protein [Candidatus Ozemobacteraceae bacterium]|nr:DUF58 domain-containing protein [Candidatus Ozemobacteraceae bacterium]